MNNYSFTDQKAAQDTRGAKAIIYVRVSSAAQVAKGQGAESQALRCAEYAKARGYNVVRVFEDKAVSGSLVDRPGMQKALAFMRAHKQDRVRMIFDDISRFARGLDTHMALRAAVQDAHGVLESPSHEFGDDGDSMLIEHLLASVSEHARVKNAEQVRNRQEARLRGGYYPFKPPIGYVTKRMDGRGKVMVRDEPIASILQTALEGYAVGRFQSQAEVARYLENQPEFPKNRHGAVTGEAANRVLTRLLYAGMVERPEWGVARRKGQHEGLISYEMFERIQDKLVGKAYAPHRVDLNEAFPLRGAVACGDCGHQLTACYSKSKTGAKHPYYMCHKKGCGSYRKSIRKADIETRFEAMLESLTPTQTLYGMIKAMFADAWEQQRTSITQATKMLNQDLKAIDSQIETLLNRIVDATSERVIGAYETKIDNLERDKLLLKEKINNTAKLKRSFSQMFELTLSFLANPCNLWKSEHLEDKQTVLRLVFSQPVEYCREEGFRTPKTSNVFKVLGHIFGEKKMMAEDWCTDSNQLFDTLTDWEAQLRHLDLSALDDDSEDQEETEPAVKPVSPPKPPRPTP